MAKPKSSFTMAACARTRSNAPASHSTICSPLCGRPGLHARRSEAEDGREMGKTTFRVVFARSAAADLDELSNYWAARDEAWRGEKYHRDLVHRAEAELSDATSARRGRTAKIADW